MVNKVFEFQNVSSDKVTKLNLTLMKNEKVIIFGPSGAGKSSFLYLFNRLEEPQIGNILYHGKSLNEYQIPLLRKQVGMVMQSPNLFPGTVIENLRYGPSLFGEWKEERAEELLDYTRLPKKLLHKPVDQLSGGEQQRVSLARTLANKPNVLLLDEPTSALDYRTAEEVEEVLDTLIKDKGLTMLMVTHNLSQAKRLGTRGIFLVDGKIIEDRPISEMLEDPKTEKLKEFMQE